MTDIAVAAGTALLVALVLLLVSSPLLYMGWKRRRRYRRLRSLPVETPETVEAGSPALVTGTVDDPKREQSSPVAGEPCVLAAWDIREWHRGRNSVWLTAARGVDGTEFSLSGEDRSVVVPDLSVEDVPDTWGQVTEMPTYTEAGIGSSELTVEAAALDTAVDRTPTETLREGSHELAQRVQIGEPDTGLGRAPLSALYRRSRRVLWRPTGTRRYREIRIEPGDQITITAERRGTGTDRRLAVREPTDERVPILSTLSPAQLRRRYRWAYWKVFYGPVTLAVAVASVIFLALLL